MKKLLFAVFAAVAVILPAVQAEETRTIHLIQDDAQVKMATKIYNIQHMKASDMLMFVEAAVRRYYANSQVRALNFAKNKQQSLIVTTAEKFIPYVDQIISTLDRGTKRNEFNSAVSGIGYKWKVYWSQYRSNFDLTLPADVMLSGNGNVFAYNGAIWLKDDMDDIDYALDWIKYFDRPLPQASLTLRYYAVRESALKDVGIDYLAWKNGPGMNLFDVAYKSGRLAWDKMLNSAVNFGSLPFSYGGIFTAPAFDMSFIRILQQSGKAKIVANATVNVKNNQDIATVSLAPAYNNQIKDEDFASHVVASGISTEFEVSILNPYICFAAKPEDLNEYGWIPFDKKFYDRNQGSILFGYTLESKDATESNNLGAQIGSSFETSSLFKTIEFGREQILAEAVREHDVEQTTGVPFLCQLPVLKYIFGTTTTSKEKIYVFVTMEAKLVHPESTVAAK